MALSTCCVLLSARSRGCRVMSSKMDDEQRCSGRSSRGRCNSLKSVHARFGKRATRLDSHHITFLSSRCSDAQKTIILLFSARTSRTVAAGFVADYDSVTAIFPLRQCWLAGRYTTSKQCSAAATRQSLSRPQYAER